MNRRKYKERESPKSGFTYNFARAIRFRIVKSDVSTVACIGWRLFGFCIFVGGAVWFCCVESKSITSCPCARPIPSWKLWPLNTWRPLVALLCASDNDETVKSSCSKITDLARERNNKPSPDKKHFFLSEPADSNSKQCRARTQASESEQTRFKVSFNCFARVVLAL